MDLDKDAYKQIVRSSLKAMYDLSKIDKQYSLVADAISYYNQKIEPEKIISRDDFLAMCRELWV